LTLVCEEEVSYRQGTDTRTEKRRVHEQELYLEQELAIDRGGSHEVRRSFRLPPGAMHSFEASHNKVRWRIESEGKIPSWPDLKVHFPLIVYPPRDGGSRA
jgi:hypothetical protein